MIIIARAPACLILGGESTDQLAFYQSHGGMTVSATINYYVYTTLTSHAIKGFQILSADYRYLRQQPYHDSSFRENDIELIRAISNYFQIQNGLRVFLASQIPPGAGLGRMGSTMVSITKALAFWCGLDLEPASVADLACIAQTTPSVGKQAQYAAAFGGLNAITFDRSGVTVEPLQMSIETRQRLREGLMLFFFTGVSPQSSSTPQHQKQASEQEDLAILQGLEKIKNLSLDIREALTSGDFPAFGELLHRSWVQKRQLAPDITNPRIDQYYEAAREQGTLGGKIIGSGDRGFLMLYCPKERQSAVKRSLEGLGLIYYPFALEPEGVQIMQAQTWERSSLFQTAFEQREMLQSVSNSAAR